LKKKTAIALKEPGPENAGTSLQQQLHVSSK
jgi:hypothetical protein